MVSTDRARALALALPGAVEQDHHMRQVDLDRADVDRPEGLLDHAWRTQARRPRAS